MIKKRRFPSIYFGWWTVAASSALRFWGHGFHTYGFSAFFKPIASELGFSRAAASVPVAIGRFEGSFEGALSGWLTDRYGPRVVVLIGVSLISLGLILMNYVDSVWSYYIIWGVILGSGTNIALSIPLDAAVTNWFVKKRGLTLGIMWVWSGLSGVITMPHVVARLIAAQGWRTTSVIGGLVMAFVGLPLAWFFFKRHRPEYYGLLPDGAPVGKEAGDVKQMVERGVKYAAEVQEVEFTFRQAIRTPAFWLLVIAKGTGSMVISGFFLVHTIPFLTDIGVDPLKAAATMSIYPAASVPFRFIGGVVADRLSKNRLRFLIGGAYLLQAIGLLLLLLTQTLHQAMSMIYLSFVIFGIGFGTTFSIPVMIGRYFGRKAFGTIRGFLTAVMAPFAMMAPIYSGWVYDTTGSYLTVFIVFTAITILAAVLLPFAKPPKPPAQVTDIR